MSKEITKANILQEIQDKFGLREWEVEKFLFSETVVPTYDIRQHTENPVTNYKTVSITSAAAFLFFTVPEDEIWHLNGYNIVFLAAGAYTVTGLYINRKLQVNPGASFYLDMLEGQTVSYAVVLPNPVRLDPFDELKVLIDGYTSTASLRVYIDYIVEHIR